MKSRTVQATETETLRTPAQSWAVHRIAAFTSHPIQYQVPLFRRLAARKDIDLTVYFGWNSIGRHDPEFGRDVTWDVPLLEGYRYRFLPNWSPRPGSTALGQVSPAVALEISRNRYDVVLAHGYASFTSLLALLAARVTGTPTVFKGEANLLRPRAKWRRLAKRLVLPPLLSHIDAFLFSCGTNKAFFEAHGVAEDKLIFAPCAVDNAFWRAQAAVWAKSRKETRARFGIPKDRSVILCAAKLVPRKRPFDLLNAHRRLSLTPPPCLVFVGDGLLRGELERYTAEEGIDNVTFTGFMNQKEIGAAYSVADVFVLPSAEDPSPKAVNEAMNFALPVVTSRNVGTAPDLVKPGENGWLFRVGDVEELAAALSRVLGDPKRMRAMGERSLEIVSQWSLDAHVDAILSALERIKANRRNGRP